MTQHFTVHELRPVRSTHPKEPTPATAGPGTVEKSETAEKSRKVAKTKETGGPSGPEPTRYGDWERKGICVDF